MPVPQCSLSCKKALHHIARRAAQTHRPTGARGFTLIEGLMVVVIIGIVSVFAFPRLDTEAYKVNSAVRGVNSALIHAERAAVTLQHDVRVGFDVPNRSLRVHEDRDNDNVIDAGERVVAIPLEEGVVLARGAAPAMGFGGAAVNFTRSQGLLPIVIFRRDGTASENGGFYVNTVRGVARGSARQARAAEVVRSTGRVVWHSYATGTWTRGN